MKVCKNPPKEAEVKKPKVKSMGPLGPRPLEAHGTEEGSWVLWTPDTERSCTILQ